MSNDAKAAQHLKMTQTPIPKLVVSLSIPTAVSMLVTAVYNLADTYFVSQLGTSASGAVGIVFSLMSLIQAVGYMVGNGASSLISRHLGGGNNDAADRCAASAVLMAGMLGVLLTVFGLLFADNLLRALGATETILPYAKPYAFYILLGAPVMCLSFTANHSQLSQGKTLFAMLGLAAGSVLNILLDPVFIFALGMGTKGAALATFISQCVSLAVLFSFFLCGKSVVSLSPRPASRSPGDYAAVLKIGFSSFCRQGLASAASAAQNRAAAVYGDAAVSAMSIVGRVFMLMLSAALGFGQGLQPVVGYNYGARRYDRVKSSFRFIITVSVIIIAILSCLCIIFAPSIIGAFRRDDPQVIGIGATAMRIQASALIFQSMIVSTIMLLQSTGKAKEATVLSCCRQGIFFFPCIILLPRLFGLPGVQIAQSVSDLFTAAAAVPFCIGFFRKLNAADDRQIPE